MALVNVVYWLHSSHESGELLQCSKWWQHHKCGGVGSSGGSRMRVMLIFSISHVMSECNLIYKQFVIVTLWQKRWIAAVCLSQDLEVAAEFQLADSVSISELMNKFAETNHVKVWLLLLVILSSVLCYLLLLLVLPPPPDIYVKNINLQIKNITKHVFLNLYKKH